MLVLSSVRWSSCDENGIPSTVTISTADKSVELEGGMKIFIGKKTSLKINKPFHCCKGKFKAYDTA